MITKRSEAAKAMGYFYHTVRWWESKPNWPGYPMTLEQLLAFRATMQTRGRKNLKRFKYVSGEKVQSQRRLAFGRMITRRLKVMGQNRKWLAMTLGVAENTVANWINGLASPRDAGKVGELLRGKVETIKPMP